MSLQSVRGTHDLLPAEMAKHRYILNCALRGAETYGFREISTPIFEFSEVFKRTLGDASDIVTKEMYSFQDKGEEWLTLRPEGTAGVARAFISNSFDTQVAHKLFYHGPMFRYERPQKGRQRQFHQFGVEFLGLPTPLADLECLALADLILTDLKIRSRAQLELNSIGDKGSRQNYLNLLLDYLSKYANELSPDSQKRLKTNPLRILDSKDSKDQKILESAPNLSESLNTESRTFFEKVCRGLEDMKIPFLVNPRLVRGLDYYCHTVFEYRTQALGAQDAILSGGRYDELIKVMGGKETPGVGWAAGMERLVLLLESEPPRPRPVAIVSLGERPDERGFLLAHELRTQGIYTEFIYSGNMSKKMKKATAANARWCVILGEQELQSKSAAIKDLDSGQQQSMALDELATFFSNQLKTN